jgi:ferredoxin
MEVWIDQDLCTGDALCTETVPEVFWLGDDSLARVKGVGETALYGNDGKPLHEGEAGKVLVSANLEADVKEAALDCPGECIFIED